MSTEATTTTLPRAVRRPALGRPKFGVHLFLIVVSIMWLAPLLWTFYTSLRPYSDTAKHGYVSLPGTLNFKNYTNAWTNADMPHYFLNSLLITLPAVAITLFLAACVAFVVTRLSLRFNVTLLILFTAANLLPQQVILTPLYRMYLQIPLPTFLSENGKMYDSIVGLIAIHVAFQLGFCTFVLSNYMKTIPTELNEAAQVDGASVWRQYWQIIMPLCRPPLAALATLEFTWIYNDFFWAVVLEQQGADRPITSSLANLGGEFFTDDNLIAAASMYVALPTLIVYLVLQRYFIAGLTIGAEKG